MGAFSDLRLGTRRFVLLAALLGAATFTAVAWAQPTVVTHQAFTTGVTNPCTGEALVVTGFMHTETEITGDRLRVQVSWQDVKATSVLGARYVATNTSSLIFNDIPPGSTTNGEATNHLIRQREDGTFVLGDDFMLRARLQITVNANGVMTVDRFEVTSFPDTCQ